MRSDVAKTILLARLSLLAGCSVSTGVEAIGMVSQKISAALEVERAAAIAAMTGNAALSPARTIAIYRPKIHANRRCLRSLVAPTVAGTSLPRRL
jgi:hypothetical protein